MRDGVAAWRRDRPPAEHADLWRGLAAALDTHAVRWLRGHDGHPDHDRAGALAVGGMPETGAASDDEECEHLLPIAWCAWCKPPRPGVLPRGYRTAGGRAYHNDPECAWLLKGQRHSQRLGRNVHDIVPVAWASMTPGEREPCESCCTPQWTARHGHRSRGNGVTWA